MKEHAHHRKDKHLNEAKRLLRDAPRTREKLQELLGVTKASAVRYLNELGAVKDDSFPPLWSLPVEIFSPIQALITHTALRMQYHAAPGDNSVYFEALKAVAENLPDPARGIALKSTEQLKHLKRNAKDEGAAFTTVAQAWFNRQVIQFDYQKPGEPLQRGKRLEVRLIEVSRANQGIYVIGRDPVRDVARTYKLQRMRKVELIGAPQAYPLDDPAYDPQNYLSHAWGVVGQSGGGSVRVRLRIKKEAVYRILEESYPSLEIGVKDKEGNLEVGLTVGTYSDGFPLEVLSWVQSWGARILDVIEPKSLRERWIKEARQVAALGE